MAHKKQRKSSRHEYWQEQVRKLSKSGLSVVAYCRETGVKAERLYKWNRRLKSKPETKRFVELTSSVSMLVQDGMKMDPFSNSLYVFCNRKHDLLKILYWDSCIL